MKKVLLATLVVVVILSIFVAGAAAENINKNDIFVSIKGSYEASYTDVYDRYVFCTSTQFSETYSMCGTANWNTNMPNSIVVGETVYTITDVQKAIEKKMGYAIGEAIEEHEKVKVDIPEGKTLEIKIRNKYVVYEYVAKVGDAMLATGEFWYPTEGLDVTKAQF